jgi:hypothetical protein
MDNLPGFNVGFWYDIGGSWNPEKKKWDLYGDTLADVDYSCNPVVRVGGAANIVPMNRRSLYGDDEQSRVFIVPGAAQGGTRLINLLSGDGAAPLGAHAVDEFDSYTFETFVAGKYRGFSFLNDWFFRDLNNFRSTPNGMGNITYTAPNTPAGTQYLFPGAHGLFDYGTMLQVGYFVIPKKLEIVGRYSMIRGNSGDPLGTGAFTTTTIPGAPGGAAIPVRVATNAFRDYHEAHEIALGLNYYFKRQLLKWSSDVSYYQGGNPAGGGQSPAGFIPGSDGWLFRSQLQMAF